MDGGAWRATVHGVAKSQRRPSIWVRRPMKSGPVPFLTPSVPGSLSSHPLLQQPAVPLPLPRAPALTGRLRLRAVLPGYPQAMPFLLQVPAQVSPLLTSLIYGGFFCLWSLFSQGRTYTPWGQGSLLCSLIYPSDSNSTRHRTVVQWIVVPESLRVRPRASHIPLQSRFKAKHCCEWRQRQRGGAPGRWRDLPKNKSKRQPRSCPRVWLESRLETLPCCRQGQCQTVRALRAQLMRLDVV